MASWTSLVALVFMCRQAFAVDEGFMLLFETSPEEVQDYPVMFTSPLPAWLRGTLVRNGAGKFEFGNRRFSHVFDAYAKLNSWRFTGNGSVLFSTRFVVSDWYRQSDKDSSVAPYLLFGHVDPPFTSTEKLGALLNGIDNPNINVFQFGGRNGSKEVATLGDFWHLYQIQLSSLKTLARVDPPVPNGSPFSSTFPTPKLSSSHPVKEFDTENYIDFVLDMNAFGCSLKLVRIKAVDKRELITSIPLSRAPYMHSFGLSQNHAIVFVNPLFINMTSLVDMKNPVDSLEWCPEMPTDVYVIDINSGDVKRFQTEAAFVMHHINAFQPKPEVLYVDAVVYPDLGFVKSLEIAALNDSLKRNAIQIGSKIKRYVINMNTGIIAIEEFAKQDGLELANHLDMPAINERFRQNQVCFVYGLVVKADTLNLSNSTLIKKDLCGRGRDKVWLSDNHYPSEPWFVARPGGEEEDDGVILSVVLDGERKQTYLGVWGAKDMHLLSKGFAPYVVPFGLHGRFFDEQ